MKNRVIRWTLLLGFIFLVIGAARYLLREGTVTVETARVTRGPMQVTVSAEGRTRVPDRFVVSASIGGHLGRIAVKEGSVVRKGAVLARITPAPLEIRSEQQRQAALRAAEADLATEEARKVQARLELEQAERELVRVSGLVEDGIRARQDLEVFQTAVASARQEFAAATSSATAAVYRAEEVKSSLLKGDRQAIVVRSPVDGVVLRISQGSERVVLSGTPILEIGDPRKPEVVFEVLTVDAVKIRSGTDVVIQNWGADQQSRGVITRVEPGAFTKVSALGVEEQRVNVIAEFRGTIPSLGDGYRVEGEIVVWSSDSCVQVPVSALFRSGSEWAVFTVEDGKASTRRITIGQRNSRVAEVISGLSEEHLVILFPDDRLSPGTRVSSQ